jgi:YjbE family integral membrane protein
MHFAVDCLSIILIDLLLAGDNALVIAMAVRALPSRRRGVAIGLGAALAVVCRVAITLVAARLLSLDFVQLAGGAFVLWIAVKVLIDSSADAAGKAAPPARLLQAVCWILVADLTMSTDNILAVAGASHGNGALIVFGLCLSIPFVIFSSRLLSVLMDRYPWIVYLGSAILGKVGAEMILTDPAVVRWLHPSSAVRYAAEAALAAAVVVAGRLLAEPAPDPDLAS